MAKADRNGQQSARQRIAAQQEAARRAEARRRLLLGGGAVAVVLVVVVVFIVLKVSQSPSTAEKAATKQPVTGTALPASVAADVTGVPVSALAAVGKGSTVTAALRPISGPPLTAGGKPEMLYIGAEFCPYCAAMRWAMAVALSRFGTLSPLRGIRSAPSPEVYPSTATLTFYKSGYASKYLAFAPVENETVTHATLQTPTPQQQAIWNKYDANSYPFIDFGNKYLATVSYDPQVLQGLTWSQIAADLSKPSSPVARGVLGSANLMTAAICKLTSNQPAGVCSAPPVTSLEGSL